MIVITGGSGFIGSHLCNLLAERGHEIRIIDIAPPPAGTAGEFVRASVKDGARLAKLFEGAEAVAHLAALVDVAASVKDPVSDFEVNAAGTLNVLEACRKAGVEHVAYASSAAVYGNPLQLPIDELHIAKPMSPYGISKLAGESYVLSYGKLFGIKASALRLFNVFGKGQSASSPYSGVITKFANALSNGHRPVIFGSGKQTRDFVHVDDVCEAFASAIQSDGFGEPINIGSGKQTSVLGLLEEMCSIFGKRPEIDFQPAREGDILHSCADISAARQKLGFAPRMALGDGLRELVEK